ncbi:MAG: phage integrase N-terminal SAM-like domain-containing protein [Anaerolineae bacterium]|nr:phage integrase N-terminal SAM-like domain-containing protein [Anaerolineae bacterium]
MEQRPKKLLEQAYTNWIKRFIVFNKTPQGEFRHPAEIQAFLTHLAVDENVAASPRNPCPELAAGTRISTIDKSPSAMARASKTA